MTSILQEYIELINDLIKNPQFCYIRFEKLENIEGDETFQYLQTRIKNDDFKCDLEKAVITTQFGDHYYLGTGTPINYQRAVEFYQQAANLNYPDAIDRLAVCYEEGEGIVVNIQRAVELYQQAADLNYGQSMFRLAISYKNGDGVEIDMPKALELYQRAANLGNRSAMNNLAVCYENGEGVEKNLEKAVEFFQQASDLGNPTSICNLAGHYYRGTGVKTDKRKAVELYKRAAKLGDEDAIETVDAMWFQEYCEEIEARELADDRVKQFMRLQCLDIGSLFYYDVKRYI